MARGIAIAALAAVSAVAQDCPKHCATDADCPNDACTTCFVFPPGSTNGHCIDEPTPPPTAPPTPVPPLPTKPPRTPRPPRTPKPTPAPVPTPAPPLVYVCFPPGSKDAKCTESRAGGTSKEACDAECANPAPPAPPSAVCADDEYCCPDAKHCLKPTFQPCLDTNCTDGQVCCPLTKECVVPGAACVSPCAATEFCCPEAKHCLTPVSPGTICDPANSTACAAGQVCCPVAHECVTVGDPCTAP